MSAHFDVIKLYGHLCLWKLSRFMPAKSGADSGAASGEDSGADSGAISVLSKTKNQNVYSSFAS